MNIGIDARMMGTQNAGIGRYIFEIVSRIIPFDTLNHYVIFFNENTTLPTEVASLNRFKNVQLVASNIRHYSIGEQTRFLWKLNKMNLDLVHFPNFNLPIFYKKPFVVTIHDVIHHKLGGNKKSNLLHFFAYKKTINHAVRNAKAIITVSEYSKKDIVNIFQVNPNNIKVIYEGTALQKTQESGEIEKIKQNYVINRPYLLFVGTLERKKNLVALTRGFDLLIKKYGHDIDLVIVGKIDKHYPEVKHKALDIKAYKRLIFTGYVEDQELAALYEGSLAFVSASLHEGFGLPGVEAMKFGLPLIVSNIEVFNEIYDNAAMYFDPNEPEDIAEKMHLFLKDPLYQKQLSSNSLRRSQIFDWNKTAMETINVYNSVNL